MNYERVGLALFGWPIQALRGILQSSHKRGPQPGKKYRRSHAQKVEAHIVVASSDALVLVSYINISVSSVVI